jgi:hypothetical protein
MRLLGLLVLATLPLSAQSVRARLEGRVPANSITTIDSLVRVANGEHLPTEPLVQKAIEGGAKHVSGDRIVKAVELNLDQYRQAQALLVRAGDTPPVTSAEVLGVVSARKRGLGVPIVERIVAAVPDERRGSALHAVADLVAHRFDPDSATDLILEAVRQGMHGLRLLDVSNATIQEIQRGRTRAEALAAIERDLPHVPTTPAPGSAAMHGARRPVAVTGHEPSAP